jgi:hypothetical protein
MDSVMKRQRLNWTTIVGVQAVVIAAFVAAFLLATPETRARIDEDYSRVDPAARLVIPRREPLVVTPLYDRPDFVSDEDLAAVLRQVRPVFPRKELRPNYIEHALRTWGVDAEFADPKALSGAEMTAFLTDHTRFVESWGEKEEPLLQVRPAGIAIRWGREASGSVHHDHWLASLTEAGVMLDTPVHAPGGVKATIEDVLRESLRDLRLDEQETEWSTMAFGLWLPPTHSWIGSEGRRFSFDLLADRLLRGDQELGVCSGTHRVYSLVLLLRMNDAFNILSPAKRDEVYAHLERVRDEITASQWEDGRWPANWPDGRAAVEKPADEELYQQVIATGHHLEWLAIAPRDLHPPDEQIRRAARWVIDTTVAQSPEDIQQTYTFYSHVGNALALWRNTRPAVFWKKWVAEHPESVGDDAPLDVPLTEDPTTE